MVRGNELQDAPRPKYNSKLKNIKMRRMEYYLYTMHEIVLWWAEHVADVDNEGTVLLSLCVTKHNATKTCGGGE